MNFMEWGKSTSEVMSTARKLNLSKTLVIISGGMDSATCLGLAKSCSKEVGCITLDSEELGVECGSVFLNVNKEEDRIRADEILRGSFLE